MKEAAPTLCLFAAGELRSGSSSPQYLQLVVLIKNMISSGRLILGQMMPSTRELAERLDVSRKTVLRAYEELLSQGYLETERGIGTFVAEQGKKANPACDATEDAEMAPSLLSRYARTLLTSVPKTSHLNILHLLNFGAAPAELLPIKQWRQCTLELWREFDWSELDYEFAPGHRTGLQTVLVDYLFRSRGLRCSSEQIAVFGSAMTPIWLLSRLLLDAQDNVVVESPGYPYARSVFESLGCTVTGIQIDEEGLDVALLDKLTPPPKLVYVTPSHDPTGITLSVRRREHLIWLAKNKNILIVEDDYDREFDSKYSRLPTLFSMCDSGQVIYLSSFWKTLYPLITCGFIVMPVNMLAAYNRALTEPDNNCVPRLPCIEEATLSRFLSQGILERHTHKISSVYASRQRAVVSAVTRHLGELAVLSKESAGMHIRLKLNTNLDRETVMEIASDTDFPLASTAPYYIENWPANEYLVPFGHLDESTSENLVGAFARRLRDRLSC